MNDKQLIETLRNIKEYCASADLFECKNCRFYSNKKINEANCKFNQLTKELSKTTPNYWNIEKLEELINEP